MSLLKYSYDPAENKWIRRREAPVLPGDTEVTFWNTSEQPLNLEFETPDAFYGISYVTVAPHSRVALNYSGVETRTCYGRAAGGPDTIPPG